MVFISGMVLGCVIGVLATSLYIEYKASNNSITIIETNLFDIEEIHENCTVQVLKNSVTGEVSVGWWSNE